LNLEITNFKSIDHFKDSFEGLTFITGENGSGKSNILKAICYALFGICPFSRASSIPHFGKYKPKISVELDNLFLHVNNGKLLVKKGEDEFEGPKSKIRKDMSFLTTTPDELMMKIYINPRSPNVASLTKSQRTAFLLSLSGVTKIEQAWKESGSIYRNMKREFDSNSEKVNNERLAELSKIVDEDHHYRLIPALKRDIQQKQRQLDTVNTNVNELKELLSGQTPPKIEKSEIGAKKSELAAAVYNLNDQIKAIKNIVTLECPACEETLILQGLRKLVPYSVENAKEALVLLEVDMTAKETELAELKAAEKYYSDDETYAMGLEKIEVLSKELKQLEDTLRKCKEQEDISKEYEELSALARTAKELDFSIDDLEDYAFLYNKGLKSLRTEIIQRDCQILEDRINHYLSVAGADGRAVFEPKIKDDDIVDIEILEENKGNLLYYEELNTAEQVLFNVATCLAQSDVYPAELDNLKIKLFDDIFNGLDINKTENLCRLFRSIEDKYIFVAHNRNEIAEFLKPDKVISL
jgi:DNA repair exonuclease SbcCD ATPase subunit